MLLHLFPHGKQPPILRMRFQRENRGRRGRWSSEQIFKNPFAALYHGRSIRIGSHGKNTALSQEPASLRFTSYRDSAKAGANHAWMGHQASAGVAERVGGEPYARLDASLTIWTFLAAQSRA